ncbi:MAG: DNA-binding response regulator [Mucilaginibacter sp.]|nr:DNA-binding response regulator [Mucilaginibacter sp.]
MKTINVFISFKDRGKLAVFCFIDKICFGKMIKVILAEDHNIVRNGIKNLLQRDEKFNIVGEALNGREVLALLEAGIIPDIILADLDMPQMGGIELIENLRSMPGYIKTILLTMHADEKYLSDAFKAGAMGYLFRNVGADELLFAINYVYNNKKYICLDLSLSLLERNNFSSVVKPNNYSNGFSKRELEILNLIAEGYTNQEIADKLYTSKRTVEGHRQALIDKTGVRNSPALVKFAVLNGIIN